jgi:PhnO protein
LVTNAAPPANFFIRPAGEGDADAVYAFISELEETILDRVSFQKIFERNLADPLVYYLIAELAGTAVGFVSCHVQYLLHHSGRVGEIQELYVKPDYRNQQIGHQLVATLTDLASSEQFINLEVTTNQKRTDTIRFYKRESFSQTHVKLVKPIQP